jgi:hypothetical protein
MEQGTVVRVVLDVWEEKDADRVVLQGVFPDDGSPLPERAPTARRNVVKAFYNVPLRIPAFCLYRQEPLNSAATSDAAEPPVPPVTP